jgi:hypothetical protein
MCTTYHVYDFVEMLRRSAKQTMQVMVSAILILWKTQGSGLAS